MFKTGGNGDGLGGIVQDALNPAFQKFLGVDVTPGYISGLIFTLLLLLIAGAVRVFLVPKFAKAKTPGKAQLFFETLVGYFSGASAEGVHRHADLVGPYTFTTATFIAVTTLAELLGLRPVFSTINACVAFGVMTFVVINISGIREFGIAKRSKRLLNPINIITDLSVPLSLSLRLFGAITSGYIIMELLYASLYTSFVLPAAASIVTTLFHAGIQAFLFATLTTIFVSEAVERN
ncbi:MAG: FoF1 ATP synthase subunit a [Clostridia bacterium]